MESAREVVVITGASAGVGRATACEFARHGAAIGLLARGKERLEDARKEMEALGGTALALPCDVSDPGQVESAAAAVQEQLGPIDVWINNAMTSIFAPVTEIAPDEFKRVTEVTYLGCVYGTMSALKRMLPRNRGVIVQVGSALAYRGIPLQAAYCASKHAIQGFVDSLRCELLHDGSHVRVSMAQMPALNTPQFDWVKSRLPHRAQPVPPVFQPEVAARAIYWLAHHNRRELYVAWPTVKAIVGNKLVPGIADHYLGRTGYDAQQTGDPENPHRPDNLWHPVDGNQGAHGRFDSQARAWSPELWASMHRGALTLLALGIAGGLWCREAKTSPSG